ncbi:MAG: hypothetical protein Athens071416_80 [Parcubacteria group bacterium Athens0714_16]|nr:MAG: hypothetical protein Athens071416_80 [Parcubacteria group bacterium Athens0714_16]
MTKTNKSVVFGLLLTGLLTFLIPVLNGLTKKAPIITTPNNVVKTLLKGTIAEKPEFYIGIGGYVKIRVSYNKVSATDDTKIDCYIFSNNPDYMQIGDSVTFRKIDIAYRFTFEEHQSSFGLITKIKDTSYSY